jgi:hypothetical protein
MLGRARGDSALVQAPVLGFAGSDVRPRRTEKLPTSTPVSRKTGHRLPNLALSCRARASARRNHTRSVEGDEAMAVGCSHRILARHAAEQPCEPGQTGWRWAAPDQSSVGRSTIRVLGSAPESERWWTAGRCPSPVQVFGDRLRAVQGGSPLTAGGHVILPATHGMSPVAGIGLPTPAPEVDTGGQRHRGVRRLPGHPTGMSTMAEAASRSIEALEVQRGRSTSRRRVTHDSG